MITDTHSDRCASAIKNGALSKEKAGEEKADNLPCNMEAEPGTTVYLG